MSRRFGALVFAGALLLVTANARAQGQTTDTVPDERPATTTIMGDTGLWFVPTGEILKDKDWAVSGYRANWDVRQGYTDISHFIGTFAYGINNRAEVFGAIRLDTRIRRANRNPLFSPSAPDTGGVVNEYPFVKQGWSGNDFGDVFLGTKISLKSQSRNSPVSVAIRPIVKLPTGSKSNGSGTGSTDFQIDGIVSSEVAKVAEVSGTVGVIWRGDPSEFDLSNGLTYGIGAQFPTRSPLKFTTEFYGEKHFSDAVTMKTPLVGLDNSTAPTLSNIQSQATLMFGATWQAKNGIFGGGGVNWSANADKDTHGTKFGWQFRLGYHPPIEAIPLPAPPPPPPPPPPPAPEHTLAVTAQANPTAVQAGGTSQVTATAKDSIGCAITWRWTAPSGTFANPTAQNTAWTASNNAGPVTLTVTGTCPTDQKSASATVTVDVVARPVQIFTFEDVYFDFDRYSLTDAATRILAQSVATLRANPTLRIRIEGHTCSIGTAEYNLALGDRRARSVMEYLISNGITADRLSSVSFGEENPKFDNSREETRRLNRRAAMTLQIVAGN